MKTGNVSCFKSQKRTKKTMPSGLRFCDSLRLRSRPEALPILSRSNKRLHHLGINVIAIELIQLRQPEIVAGVVSVGAAVWIAAEIAEELHQNERAVEFVRHEG